jgi:hypothetical protein
MPLAASVEAVFGLRAAWEAGSEPGPMRDEAWPNEPIGRRHRQAAVSDETGQKA